MNSNRTIATNLAIAYVVAFAGLAQAKSGEVTYNICMGGEVLSSTEIAPQQTISTSKYFGVSKTVPPGELNDQMSVTCYGSASTVGGPAVFTGYCVLVDKDGDKYAIRYLSAPTSKSEIAGKSETLGGSGKFTGIKGASEYKVTLMPNVPGRISTCTEGLLKYTLPD